MPKKGKGLLSDLKKIDGYCRVLTGRRLDQLIANGIELFGTDALEKAPAGQEADPMQANYIMLGADPEWSDSVVKSLYRARVREVHPDTGTKPDPVKFQKLDEAFKAIMASRKTAAT